MPRVSIIMPTCKKLDFLKVALQSVLNQDFTDYEIIVADDSVDNAIKDYVNSLNNQKINYFNNHPPLYQAANHTAGMKQAVGDFIKILHDDDYFLTTDALGKMVKLMENNPNCNFGYVNNIQVDLLTDKILRKRHASKYVDYARKNPLNLLIRNTIGSPSVTIFKNHKDVSFDACIQKAIDTDFYVSYLLKHSGIAFCRKYLIAIGQCPQQDTHKVTNNKQIIVEEIIYLYNKYQEVIAKSNFRKTFKNHIIKESRKLKLTKKDLDMIFNCIAPNITETDKLQTASRS